MGRRNKKIPGVKAIIGSAPDYVELAVQHFNATGKDLFGINVNFLYAATTTPLNNELDIAVGATFQHVISIGHVNRKLYEPNLLNVPLIVPK